RMADQAPTAPVSSSQQAEFIDTNVSVGQRFPPKGQPLIAGFNRIGLWSLYMKDVRRLLKVQTQTVWAPAVTTLLLLIIFSVAMGRSAGERLGVPIAAFLAPGLILMCMMQDAVANSSSSPLTGKLQGTIVDLLVPPLTEAELMGGAIAAARARALMVGAAVG